MIPANPNPDPTMVGVHLFDGDQELVITSSHDGNGTADDPPGYGYKYVNQVGGGEHWISARALPIRFKAASFDKALAHRMGVAAFRKTVMIDAMKVAAERASKEWGGCIVVTDKGFVVVFDHDERMYVEPLEM